jgi:hypothetical protein
MEIKTEMQGEVYCPICTHIVATQVVMIHKTPRVKPGSKCPRCAAPLDAGSVIHRVQAA